MVWSFELEYLRDVGKCCHCIVFTTLEASASRGFYFIGEVVDVTGNWAATIFSGPGPPAMLQAGRCNGTPSLLISAVCTRLSVEGY